MLGLYVHIPFCAVKCFYCDFTAFAGQRKTVGRYLDALRAEAALHEGLAPRTLYVGGGTPSELSAPELERMLSVVSERFGPVEGMAEATVEANPESLDEEKLLALRRGGVGRLSLGLQTAEPRLLAAIGRKHGFEDFLRAYRRAKELGFSVSVDLMFGLPGQDAGDHRRSLKAVLDLEPDHLSLYGLQVEDRTLFAKREVEVDEDLARAMMEESVETLARAGYRHYEISNFARPGRESLHNVNYWLNGPYIGLGCGAAGFLDGVRWQNDDRLASYCDRALRGEAPRGSEERLAGKAAVGETLMLGLRMLSGVPLTPRAQELFAAEIESLVQRGLAELDQARLRLTRAGVFLANEAFREFVAPFRTQETPV